MSKFNKSAVGTKEAGVVANAAGGVSFKRNDYKQDIAQVVMTSLLNGDKFYEKETDRLKRIEKMLLDNKENSEFLAKAMVYARTVGNLRSISHFMGSVLVENVKGTDFLRSALTKAIVRPDDATEMVALYTNRNKGMVPNSLRRAIKDSLETKWDEYQLKKYEGNGNKVKLKDIVKLSHPNPKQLILSGKAKDAFVFKRVIESTLENIQTAQTVNASAKGDERASNYKEMLSNGKLGYMAALKNIKNILEAGADKETVNLLCKYLANKNAVLKSKVLPFRFYDAYKEVNKMSLDRFVIKQVSSALEEGFKASASNIEFVEKGDRTAVLLDDSGSMSGQPFDIGKVMTSAILSGLDSDNTVGYLWAERAKEINVRNITSPLDYAHNLRANGGGTDVGSAIRELIRTNTVVDKIIILTDMQHNSARGFDSTLREYRSKLNKDVVVVFWNLAGYSGGTPAKLTDKVLEVSGFSDKLFEVVSNMLKYSNGDYLIEQIEAITL